MMFCRLHTWRQLIRSRISRSAALSRLKALHQQRGGFGVAALVEQLEERTLLTAIAVTSTLDTVDLSDGVTTLREAVIAANNSAGDDTITLPAGIYTLTIAGEDAAATGDLDITDTTGSLTITGAGAGTTVIDAGGDMGINDRIFDVLTGVILNVAEVTITGGQPALRGGGLLNAGTLTLTNSTVSGNLAQVGGGISNLGTVTVTGSTISGNSAEFTAGGIFSGGSNNTVTINNSTISGNSANSRGGGGIFDEGSNSTVTITNSTISGNSANSSGGGILSTQLNSTLTISNSTISDNTGQIGGISSSGTLTISSSTISGNVGGIGGISSSGETTITDSRIFGNYGSFVGGINIGGTYTITGSEIFDNATGNSGGGMQTHGTGIITNSTISDNSSPFGGGITNTGTLTLIDSIVSGNSAEGPFGGSGGGIMNSFGTLTITNSIMSGNSAGTRGSAIYNRGSQSQNRIATLIITDSTISDNSSPSFAIENADGAITMTRSTISGNSGGGIASSGTDSTLAIVGSTISGNGRNGIRFSGSTLTLTNSTVSGNSASAGAGIEIIGVAVVTINNSTITDNLSPATSPDGGGITNRNSNAVVNVKNSIIARNTLFDVNTSGVFNSLGNNLIGDVGGALGFTNGVNGDQVGGAGNAVIDPQLGPLQNNGGPTFTHALLPDSPAIDAGNNTGVPATDQRGVPRPFDIATIPNASGGDGSDIGAFEFGPAGTPEGENVVVEPVDETTGTTDVSITFSTVTESGTTSLTTSGAGQPPPANFKLGTPRTYFDLTTTTTFSGSIMVCIGYSGMSFKGKEENLKLFHFEDTTGDGTANAWVDTTISLDTTNDIICASVTSLSPFAIFEPVNQPPITVDDVAGEATISEDGAPGPVDITADILANDSDPDLDPLTVVAINDSSITAGILDLSSGVVTYDPNGEFESLGVVQTATQTFTYTIDDGNGEQDTATVEIVISGANDDPTVGADGDPVTVSEGDLATNTGAFDDVDGSDNVTISASTGTITFQDSGNSGTWSWEFNSTDGPIESQLVTITADDGNGGMATTQFQLNVSNVAPTVTSITVPRDPVNINDQPVSASAEFIDPAGTNDEPYTCSVDYGDGTGTQTGTVALTTCTGPNHTYSVPGVYTVTVAVTDKDAETRSADATDFIVIYDATGGFVTGGGSITSPAGALIANPSATGKATFGFVSKYKNGASTPTGNTEFQFKTGDLNFHSTSYDWLVIAGQDKAKYKGEGTINGGGNYGFMLTAVDNGNSGDTFRIKIWDKNAGDGVVYDNKVGSGDDSYDGTVISGGNIKVHKPKTAAAAIITAGDGNFDGLVNFSDFIILANNFGRTDAVWEDGDFNGDGAVDFSDFLILSANFSSTRPQLAAPALSATSQTLPTANISAADELFERFDDELSLDNLL